jgi:hypothetical protein
MKIPNWNKLVETIGVEGIMNLVNGGTYEASVREQGTCTYDRTYRVSLSLDEVFFEHNIEEMINERWDEDSIMDWFYDNANIIDEGISYGEETHFETDDYDAEDYDWEVSDGSRLNDLVEAIINEQ